MISGRAKLAGVMGWPVAHSLSPRLHNHWLREAGVDGAYVPLAVPPEELAAAFRLLPRLGFVGWNLTVPHKEQALALVDALDDAARAIGAVNTVVVRQDGTLLGRNTDAHGFIHNLKCTRPELAAYKHKAVVLGAGGAGRAVVYALKQEGFAEIVIINRSVERAQALAEEFGVHAAPWDMRARALEGAGLLVNTTTLGMQGQPPLELSLARLPASALVADIVYKPLLTPLLEAARAHGCTAAGGLGMLIHQAAPGFEAWFGAKPGVDGALEAFLLS